MTDGIPGHFVCAPIIKINNVRQVSSLIQNSLIHSLTLSHYRITALSH